MTRSKYIDGMSMKAPLLILVAVATVSISSPLLKEQVTHSKVLHRSWLLTFFRLPAARRGGWMVTRWTLAAFSSPHLLAPTGEPQTTSASLRLEAPWQKSPPRYNSILSGLSWVSWRWRAATCGGSLERTWGWTVFGNGRRAILLSGILSGPRLPFRWDTGLKTAWRWTTLWILWVPTHTATPQGHSPFARSNPFENCKLRCNILEIDISIDLPRNGWRCRKFLVGLTQGRPFQWYHWYRSRLIW